MNGVLMNRHRHPVLLSTAFFLAVLVCASRGNPRRPDRKDSWSQSALKDDRPDQVVSDTQPAVGALVRARHSSSGRQGNQDQEWRRESKRSQDRPGGCWFQAPQRARVTAA